MESSLTMLMHSAIIVVILYLGYVHGVGVSRSTASHRSLFAGGLVLSYMIMFGHGLPTKINPKLLF